MCIFYSSSWLIRGKLATSPAEDPSGGVAPIPEELFCDGPQSNMYCIAWYICIAFDCHSCIVLCSIV